MDLIDREKAIEEVFVYDAAPVMLRKMPSAFEGMTNGEVIQAVFDVMVLTVKDGKVWVEKIYFPFDEIWWNSPYQKGDKYETI